MKYKGIIILVLFSLALWSPCRPVKAEEGVKFETDSVTFTYYSRSGGYDYYPNISRTGSDDDLDIISAISTNKQVAEVNYDTWCMFIDPRGVGECDAIATDAKGNKATIHVVVKPSFFADRLKTITGVGGLTYGTKKIEIESIPGATGKLTIGKKTYKFTIPKSDYDSATKTIKIKKVYKLNTKVKYTITAISDGKKYTITRVKKIFAYTPIDVAKATKKTLTLKIFNLHKGDVVKVKYKGKYYTKKIKKDFDDKYYKVKFKLKKKMKKNSSFVAYVYNKDRKKLDRKKITLINWKYAVWGVNNPEGDADYEPADDGCE